jgi:hypothetical protein
MEGPIKIRVWDPKAKTWIDGAIAGPKIRVWDPVYQMWVEFNLTAPIEAAREAWAQGWRRTPSRSGRDGVQLGDGRCRPCWSTFAGAGLDVTAPVTGSETQQTRYRIPSDQI